MTREEAIKMLSILKAAYPNSYRGMTKDEANGTIAVWSMQFSDIPFKVVAIAVNKLISTNTFPPSISEVKQRIQSLYWEAWQMLEEHKRATTGTRLSSYDFLEDKQKEEVIYSGKKLDDRTLETVKEIIKICEPLRTKQKLEPTLNELLTGFNTYLVDSSDKPLLK